MKVIFVSGSSKAHRIERRRYNRELKGKTILQAIIFWFYTFIIFLISRNHRMTEVIRNLWKSSCPTPLFEQGHLE